MMPFVQYEASQSELMRREEGLCDDLPFVRAPHKPDHALHTLTSKAYFATRVSGKSAAAAMTIVAAAFDVFDEPAVAKPKKKATVRFAPLPVGMIESAAERDLRTRATCGGKPPMDAAPSASGTNSRSRARVAAT